MEVTYDLIGLPFDERAMSLRTSDLAQRFTREPLVYRRANFFKSIFTSAVRQRMVKELSAFATNGLFGRIWKLLILHRWLIPYSGLMISHCPIQRSHPSFST